MAARTLTPGWTRRRNCASAASTRRSPSPSTTPAIFTKDAPGFGPDREGGAARVIDDNGKKGDANKAVIDALIERNMLFARGRLKHQYPHCWRSKKPVIFRNTPQWFVHMDKELEGMRTPTLQASPRASSAPSTPRASCRRRARRGCAP